VPQLGGAAEPPGAGCGRTVGLEVPVHLARRLAVRRPKRIDRHGPLCATPGGVETPGLMLGLAGIGYGLLRLADPDRVPSVLALEAPRSR
jgi:lantibiotic modifying enzyme